MICNNEHLTPVPTFEDKVTSNSNKLVNLSGDRDIVVIPSISMDSEQLEKVKSILHYEERLLFHILSLQDPSTRLFYFTSIPLDPTLIDYYIGLIPLNASLNATNIMSRLTFLSPGDGDLHHCLSQKILMRPSLLEHIVKACRSPEHACLEVFRGTFYEEEIARILSVPLNSSKAKDLYWGTKSGSRTVFKALGLPHPDGTYVAEKDYDTFIRSILEVLKRNNHAKRGLVKLDECFGGKGNAVINLAKVTELLRESKSNDERALEALHDAWSTMKYSCDAESKDRFFREFKVCGAIFELFIESRHDQNHNESHSAHEHLQTSPSVQCRIHPDKTVEVISTHEQILDGQVYYGCRFPSIGAYRRRLMEYGLRVGEFLADKGIVDHFSVDFMGDPPCNYFNDPNQTEFDKDDYDWTITAVEINLRLTGTTHPMLTMANLSLGKLDERSGEFYVDASPINSLCKDNANSNSRSKRCYVAYDVVHNDLFCRLLPSDLVELLCDHPLHWNHETKRGIVFHMMGGVAEFGSFGLTCIGYSSRDCDELYTKTVALVQEKAEQVSLTIAPGVLSQEHFSN